MEYNQSAILSYSRKKRIIFDKACEVAAKIVLKYGKKTPAIFTTDTIRKFWDLPDVFPPSVGYFLSKIKMPVVWWWINNNLSLDDKIWNADFIHGVAQHGKINWYKHQSPTLWFSNLYIKNVIKDNPIQGHVSAQEWTCVPAFYLKYSKESISFMAGFFSVFVPHKKENKCYAVSNRSTMDLLKKWNIPIEKTGNKYIYLSPIWPALLTPWMPEHIRSKWFGLKKAYRVRLYAPILWKTHMGKEFRKNGIPYLKSRRTIFYEYKNDEVGALKYLDKLRVSMNLTELDNRIGEIIRKWGHNEVSIN
jgi:hypothetical protein